MVEIVTGLMLLVAAWFDFRTMRIPNLLQIIALLTVTLSIAAFDPHSWRVRCITSALLTGFFFLLSLLKQSGGGDLKMMVWFGAGFGLGVWVILAVAVALMGLTGIIAALIRKKQLRWLPLAPFLMLGLVVWKLAFE